MVNDALTPVSLSLADPSDFFALMKPRVMSLVVFTAWVGLVCAPAAVGWFTGAVIILCIAAGAGASGALNMWYDADIDARMTRTRGRPLPQGKMARESALIFGIIVGALSVWGLYWVSNVTAALLLAFTIFFYLVIYSMWLKRRTPQNIVIGGAAGAFPPMIGWVAVTGDIPLNSVLLFMIIFIWTPPHFWALALYKRGDYAKVGIPMMPNVKGAPSTRNQIFAYSLLLAATTIAPVFTGLGGTIYMVAAILLNAAFLGLAFRVWRSSAGDEAPKDNPEGLYDVRKGNKAARDLFAYSIIYLFAVFAVLAFESLLKVWTGS
ncbi:MAG: heme o synthase [Maricaulaceae bacterium]